MKRTTVFLTLFLLISTSTSLAAGGTWTKVADMPTRRCCAAAVALNGKIYVVGGLSPAWAPLATVEMYDTGFREPQAVSPQGKLTTTWGEIKGER